MNYEAYIIQVIESDPTRMRALDAVKTLQLPDCFIAAGFIRDKIWSSLYGQDKAVSDVDVIYFCATDSTQERDLHLEQQLSQRVPELAWSVKNQARMHIRNGDSPYKNSTDAMTYWPEKQTAIGARLNEKNQVILQAPFGLAYQFNGKINRNPARSVELFMHRLNSKGWIESWPVLQVES